MKYLLLFFLLSACASPPKEMDTEVLRVTRTGFRFKFPNQGKWYPVSLTEEQEIVGKRPSEEGYSTLAFMKHGAIQFPQGKEMTNRQIFEEFKKQIEKDSTGGIVSLVKSEFSFTTYQHADCMTVSQTGAIHKNKTSLSSDALICIHPRRSYHFIWLALSERWPEGKSGQISKATKKFFSTLSNSQNGNHCLNN